MKVYKKMVDIPLTLGSKNTWEKRGFRVCCRAEPVAYAKIMMPGFIGRFRLYDVLGTRLVGGKLAQLRRLEYWEMVKKEGEKDGKAC